MKVVKWSTHAVDTYTQKMGQGFMGKGREHPFFDANDSSIRKANLAYEYTDHEISEYIRCKKDIIYFATNYCKIKNEQSKIEQIKLRPYQVRVLRQLVGEKFSILLQSRQTGKTVTTCIFLLWYCIFHNNKNVMVVANIRNTVIEIVSKIKNIYQELPFWLKPGVTNWSENKVVFDTDCRILTSARSKTPAIGFAIDVLYMDEFAHIPAAYIEPYYMNAIPTISSMKDSKIIISSTPAGDNLFKRLVDGAEAPVGHPDHNEYVVNKTYWYEVPGRDAIWLEVSGQMLARHSVSLPEFYGLVVRAGFRITETEHISGGTRLHCYHDQFTYEDIGPIGDTELTPTARVRDLAVVSSWKNREVGTMGGGASGEENFNQQYNLLFNIGSRTIFSKDLMSKLHMGVQTYAHMPIPQFKHLTFDYKELEWLQGHPELFHPRRIKEYTTVMSVDPAEGLSKCYSAIGIFRVVPISIEEARAKIAYDSITDFFRLVQIGQYRSSTVSTSELAHVIYLLTWHVFNPDLTKIALEWNTYGQSVVDNMRSAFGGNNNFSSAQFFQYPHSKDRPALKIGYKVTGNNKEINVKRFQTLCEQGRIVPSHYEAISEMDSFTKRDTSKGVKFEADSGNDDMVMSMVALSTAHDNLAYRTMLENMLDNGDMDEELRTVIYEKLENRVSFDGMSTDEYVGMMVASGRSGNRLFAPNVSEDDYDMPLGPTTEGAEWGENTSTRTKDPYSWMDDANEAYESGNNLYGKPGSGVYGGLMKAKKRRP